MSRRGALFDVDGTLVDSSYIHAVCWWQALRQAGHDVLTSSIHRAIGMGSDRLVPHVLGDDTDADIDALKAAHAAIYSTWWPSLRALPGAADLLRSAKEAGLVTVLATSASKRELAVLRRVLAADAWIDHATSDADSDASKPAPDLVQVALATADLEPQDAAFVGDAVWDVHAASGAGVRCIGLECGGSSEAELREAGAAQVYRDPADLLAHWDDSLLGRGAVT
ncbi:MAG TPA: HAD family hydrolase [Mycobacteriales bacterium]